MECNNTDVLVAQADKIDNLDFRPIAIRATNVIKKYKVGKQIIRAIDDVSVDIHEGEFVALVGPSGSGKSTLLHLLGGLDKPTSGEIVVGGKNVSSMNDRQLSKFRNQTIGFVFQSFYLQPFLTLRRNIEVASMPQRMRQAERKLRIESLARQVGLYDRLSHRPNELSGGQIQRAAIARALLNRPAIILADEPTGNLDEATAWDVIEILKEIAHKEKKCVIVVTHSKELASEADMIIRLGSDLRDNPITK